MGVKIREKLKDSGVWWLFINYKGKRTSRQIGKQKAAEKAMEHAQARLKLGMWLPEDRPKKNVPTLKEYFQKIEKTHLAMAVRESTAESYELNFRLHILPELGALPLDEITRDRVKEFVAGLMQKEHARTVTEKGTNAQGETIREVKTICRTYAKTTIRIVLAELCAVLNHAKEDGHIITENPATRLSKFYKRAKTVHENVQPLTVEEVPRFLAVVREMAPEYFPLFLCAIHTGMRSGELAALRWSDVDFNGSFIRVQKNISRGQIGATKTGKSRRVDISDELLQALKQLRSERRAEYLSRGKNEIPEWAFLGPGQIIWEDGKPVGRKEGQRVEMHNVINRVFHKCLEKAGLRRIRFHDLRHTNATLLLMQGESPVYVKDQLGHSSIKMTVDIYGHWIPGANRRAVNMLPGLTVAT